jgi:hypothetical protein
MRRSRNALAVLFSFSVAVGCGGSGGGKRLADADHADAGSLGPDSTVSDIVTLGPDSISSDAIVTEPDVAGSPDVGSDARKTEPDANISDASDAKPDGSALDAADATVDRGPSDAAEVGPDSRTSDLITSIPDGGTYKDEIVRACVVAASCASFSNTYSASRCIQEFGKTASRQDDLKLKHLLTCAKATNCSDFNGCWGGDLFTLEPFVTDGQCDKSNIKVTPTGASGPQFLNCSAMGGVCEALATGVISVTCNAQSCSGAARPAPACDGTTASGCGGSAEYRSLDCAWSGRKCQIDGSYAVCAGTGAACSDADKVTCAGSVATYCSGGARATVDCAKTGSATRCAAGAPSTEPCTAAATECDPTAFVDQCDGNKLKVCADGSIVSIGCNDIGLVLCWPGSIGTAKCMPGT